MANVHIEESGVSITVTVVWHDDGGCMLQIIERAGSPSIGNSPPSAAAVTLTPEQAAALGLVRQ